MTSDCSACLFFAHNAPYYYYLDTWFRFLVKQLFRDRDKPFPEFYTYDWYKMGFFSTWKNSADAERRAHKSILCLDFPETFKTEVLSSLHNSNPDHFEVDPYAFHQIIIRSVVNIFDKSIWTIRDVVRSLGVQSKKPLFVFEQCTKLFGCKWDLASLLSV